MKKLLLTLLLATNAHALTADELAELSACQMVNNANPSQRCVYLQRQHLAENYVAEPKPGDANYYGAPIGWEYVNQEIEKLGTDLNKLGARLDVCKRKLKKLKQRRK